MKDIYAQVLTINSTVQALREECSLYTDETKGNLEMFVQRRQEVEEVTKAADNAAQNVNDVVQKLASISTVDTAGLQDLQREISSLRSSFTSKDLASSIAALREQSQIQEAFIAKQKARVEILTKEIGELTIVRQSMESLSGTCN